MKDLLIFLNEEGIAATPGNTVGMGNPMPAGVNGEIGTEPLPTAKAKKEKRKRKISESIFDDDDIVNDANEPIILEFIEQNYKISGGLRRSSYSKNNQIEIKNGIVNIYGDITCENRSITSLTNGLFKFGKVEGKFDCSYCDKLKNLEGAPVETRNFDCSSCDSLKNLEGAPKKTEKFECSWCPGLKALKGAPVEVHGDFNCSFCKNLKTIIDGPKKVLGSYYCYCCPSLESLEGMANGFEYTGAVLSCSECHSLKNLKGVPEKITCEFVCNMCKSLESLEGAPKKCRKFNCSRCDKLKNLIGGPTTVTGEYDCSNCKSLESLEGAPEEIKGDFHCVGCDKLSKSDILNINAREVYYT